MSDRKTALPPAFSAAIEQARTRWMAFAPRERRAFRLVAAVLLVFVIFTVGVRPAWRTIQTAPQQLDRLDAQLQGMGRLAAESRELRQAPPVSVAQAADVLTAATERLGANARLTLLGDRVTLTLTGVQGDALANWLREARVAARAKPTEAQLLRNPQGYAGTVTLSLGAAQ